MRAGRDVRCGLGPLVALGLVALAEFLRRPRPMVLGLGVTVSVDAAVLLKALETITKMHQEQSVAWMGPMEIQRQLLLALGIDAEEWREKNYGTGRLSDG